MGAEDLRSQWSAGCGNQKLIGGHQAALGMNIGAQPCSKGSEITLDRPGRMSASAWQAALKSWAAVIAPSV